MKKFRGIVVPLGTPLDKKERVDEKGMRKLVNHVLGGGVQGVFVAGAMGAFDLLAGKEKLRAIEIVVDEVGGRVPVMAGASDTSLKEVIEKTKAAKKLGANAVSILPSYFSTLGQKEIIRFYSQIAKEVDIPIFIYNNPVRTGVSIEVETVIELSKVKGIVGIKDSSQDAFRWQRLIRHFRNSKNFTIFLGTEFLVTLGLIMGADGVIAGLHNVVPQIAVDLYNAVKAGKVEKAYELQDKLIELWDIFKYGNIWGGFEVALQVLGICDKVTAEPFLPIFKEKERKAVESILRKYLAV
jgi:4-hydroxy-tetrahydrodipicolinate synthase